MADPRESLECLSGPVREWFARTHPAGPTPAQGVAWPAVASGEHLLLISPTGTGKTLAGFLGILDRLFRDHARSNLAPGLHCVYISPLRSLGYDIERNLATPLEGICQILGLDEGPIRVGVRTGDTSAYERRKIRDHPPHILITTPESLAVLLSQPGWAAHWRGVRHVIVDELHALVPTKRGADLAVSLERLTRAAQDEPQRIGLSATSRPPELVARFLVGTSRSCRIAEAAPPPGALPTELVVEALVEADEGPHRGLAYRRLIGRLRRLIAANRTTVIFANTRPLTEKITHDLRHHLDRASTTDGNGAVPAVAAHHSSLHAARRREVESQLREGRLRAVVTSTSLELGVDIGSADLTVQVGAPGGVARFLQRVGRSGHRVGAASRGILLGSTPAEVAAAAVTARAARRSRLEPLRMIATPLDVVCQQILGMACSGECSVDETFALIREAAPMAGLSRNDYDACLDYLAGELASPPGAYEPEPGAAPRWSSARLWKRNGWFGIRSPRVGRWLRTNIGTITSEESVQVLVEGTALGSLEGNFAERLAPGDRFVLDGRTLEFRRLEGLLLHARPAGNDGGGLPVWHSDRQALSSELAGELAAFRHEAAVRLSREGSLGLRTWLMESLEVGTRAASLVGSVIESQELLSEVPDVRTLLVEEFPSADTPGFTYAFHAPLNRSACEALARASVARLGRRFGRDISLQAGDLGWSVRLPEGARIRSDEILPLLEPTRFSEDVLEGLDRGELPARRFRHIAATALMVLRNPEKGRRVRVGGLHWVSTRLYPLVKAACPQHPLLRETRREVLEDLLDVPAALSWMNRGPDIRLRSLPAISPFAATWIAPGNEEPVHFESPAEAIRRLHARLTLGGQGGSR